VVVSNITAFNTIENTLFADKRTEIFTIVNNHINKEALEGNSNIALDLTIYYGVIGYLSIISHEYTTIANADIEDIKERFNFNELNDCLYCKGYHLEELINQIID